MVLELTRRASSGNGEVLSVNCAISAKPSKSNPQKVNVVTARLGDSCVRRNKKWMEKEEDYAQ